MLHCVLPILFWNNITFFMPEGEIGGPAADEDKEHGDRDIDRELMVADRGRGLRPAQQPAHYLYS